MIGRYMVIDTTLRDRFVGVKFVSETASYIEVMYDGAQTSRRRHKRSVDIVSTHEAMEDATRAAERLTAKLSGARKHYNQRVTEIIADARVAGGKWWTTAQKDTKQ
jgi:hypothetical protein